LTAKPTLYLIRGAQGSGKTRLAEAIKSAGLTRFGNVHLEADMYWTFLGHGQYAFDAKRLGEAHDWLKRGVEKEMRFGLKDVIVSGTLTTCNECQPYYDLAEKYGYVVNEIICRGDFGNTHGVPEEVVKRKREAIEL
jgi:predicted ABC-type ATPase